MNFIISNIKTYIENEGLTYKEFGAIIDKKSSVVGSYLRGEAQISVESLIKFAEEIGETLDYIVFKDWKKTYTKEFGHHGTRNSVHEESASYQAKNKAQDPIDFNKILQALQNLGELHKTIEQIVEDNKKIHQKLDLAYSMTKSNRGVNGKKKDTKD